MSMSTSIRLLLLQLIIYSKQRHIHFCILIRPAWFRMIKIAMNTFRCDHQMDRRRITSFDQTFICILYGRRDYINYGWNNSIPTSFYHHYGLDLFCIEHALQIAIIYLIAANDRNCVCVRVYCIRIVCRIFWMFLWVFAAFAIRTMLYAKWLSYIFSHLVNGCFWTDSRLYIW